MNTITEILVCTYIFGISTGIALGWLIITGKNKVLR